MRILRLIPFLLLFTTSAVAQLSYEDFSRQLSEKLRFKDTKGYDRVMKNNAEHAISHFRAAVRALMVNPENENSQAIIEQIGESWKRVFRTETLDKVDRWCRSLDRPTLQKFDQARNTLNQGINQFFALRKDRPKERKLYEDLNSQLMKLAEQLEYLGEMTQSSKAWGLISQVYLIMPEPTLEDRKDSVFAIERFKEQREAWDYIRDTHYIQNVNWMKGEKAKIKEEEELAKKRAEEGYSDDIAGVESYLSVDADKVEKAYELSFAALKKPKLIDLSIQGGPSPLRWASVAIPKGGKPTAMPWFRGADMYLVRPGSSKYGITLDGAEANLKKNKFTPISAANKLKKASLFHLDADKKRPYAMWFYTGSASEPFQGMNHNFEPTWDRSTVYYKSASSWVTNIEGVPVTFYDDNSDGRILTEDYLTDYGLKLRTITDNFEEETPVEAVDSMSIGKKGKPIPFSNWVKIGGKWFHLRAKDGGNKIGLRPTNPAYFKTGTIQVKWTGQRPTKLQTLLVQGRGWFKTARFDVSAGTVEVPVGDYKIIFGRIMSGKGARLMTADLLHGSMDVIKVEEGKTAQIKLGAPFKLDFTRGGEGRDLSINALSIKVVGAAGEMYRHTNGGMPAPEIFVAKDDSGKGAKAIGEFVAIADPQTVTNLAVDSPIGFEVGYWPIVKGGKPTFVFETFIDEGLLVGLKQDKNKLFGKLLPIFK